METERVLSLSDIAKSLAPGSQISLGAAETLSDQYDSALEVLLERKHQLASKLREASLHIYYLQKHCLQLRNTLTEAKKGNHSVLQHDHFLLIDNDNSNNEDANGSIQIKSNGRTHGNADATAQNGVNDFAQVGPGKLVLHHRPFKTFDGQTSKFRNANVVCNSSTTENSGVPYTNKEHYANIGSDYNSPTTKRQKVSTLGMKSFETKGQKKKVETRGRKKKPETVEREKRQEERKRKELLEKIQREKESTVEEEETRGGNRKVVTLPPTPPKDAPVLLGSISQVLESLPIQNPVASPPENKIYPIIPAQEQAVHRGTTNGPYSFRSVTKVPRPSYYASSEIVDRYLGPLDHENEEKKTNGHSHKSRRKQNVTSHKRKRLALDTEGSSVNSDSRMETGVSDTTNDADMELPPLTSMRLMTNSHYHSRTLRRKPRTINGSRRSARDRRAIKFIEEHSDMLQNPKFPLQVGPKATLINIGEIYPATCFYNEYVIFPIGYELIREFRSIVTPNTFSNYTCKITKEGDHPLFHVLPHDAPGVEITSLSPSGCWTEILKRANKLIAAGGRANTASGIEYFQLGHPIPKLLIELLPDAEKCVGYKFVHPGKVHLNEHSTH